jgi:coenzyme F420-reducing hydrogenase delta subunit
MKFRLVNEPDRIVQKNLSPSEAEKLADLLKAYAEKARTINEGR